jgi:hypothetical protein
VPLVVINEYVIKAVRVVLSILGEIIRSLNGYRIVAKYFCRLAVGKGKLPQIFKVRRSRK